jgi:putative ABC transport system permease protein
MQLSEIIKIALIAIRSNKLRSALTLLGIVIGVFSIIAVMTAVNVLQNSIESGLSNLGTHTFQIQKQPVIANRTQWMKSLKWKDITYEQAKAVKEQITLAQYVVLEHCREQKPSSLGPSKPIRMLKLAVRIQKECRRTTGLLKKEEILRMMM